MIRTTHSFTRWTTPILKIAISVGLIWFALLETDFTSVANRVVSLPAALVALVLALMVVQVLMTSLRWCQVAKADQISLPFPVALRIVFIGLFFNQTLPTSVGGDVFRIWLLHRRGTALGRAAGNVMLDRIVGLEALLITSLLGLPVLFQTLQGPAPWSVLTLCSAGLVGFVILLVAGGKRGAFLDRWRATTVIRDAARAAGQIVTHPVKGLAVLMLSISVHLMTVAFVTLFLNGFGHHVSFALLMALVPPVFLVTIVPISMAGWGVREGAMVMSLGLAGIPAADALAVSLLVGLGMFVLGLPGGLLWLSDTGKKRFASVRNDISVPHPAPPPDR